MLRFNVRRFFCIEKDIKLSRRTKEQPKEIEDTDSIDIQKESENIQNRVPFYRFPHGFMKPLGLFTLPMLYYQADLNAAYFTEIFTDTLCKYHDIYIFGFAGAVGALIGCSFVSNYTQTKSRTYLTAFAFTQLVALGLSQFLMYDFNPLVIVPSFVGISIFILYTKYSIMTPYMPKCYYQFCQKSVILAVVALMMGVSGILLTKQYESNMILKLEQMQQLSDTMKT